jgi:hypothetical protein
VNRNGTNNIFHKLKVEIGKDIEGIGCPAHILHNTVSTAADRLSTDVEAIVGKIFNYFSIYTIRTEKLKDLCEFVNVTYKSLQSHSRTRRVPLMPAVERILQFWEALKSYFLTEEESPKVLFNFFSDAMSEVYFWFIYNQLGVFKEQINKVQGSNIPVIEVKSLLDGTLCTLNKRKEEHFVGMKVK